VKVEAEAGTIFLPETPIALESALDLAAAGRLGMETILFFDWVEEDSESWFRRLALIPLVARSAAVTWENGRAPLQIIARLSPGLEPNLWALFLRDFLGTNGQGYGLAALAALPARITAYRPDLVPEAALRAALGAYLEEVTGWEGLIALLERQDMKLPPGGEKDDLLDGYFACCYSEAE
jgi:hypothetical protein